MRLAKHPNEFTAPGFIAMQKWLTAFTIGLMHGFRIPISVFPFWYANVRSERSNYRPFYQPWRADDYFLKFWRAEQHRGVTLTDTAYLLFSLARMAASHPGEIWECGVYQGSTAKLLAAARDHIPSPLPLRTIRLFDSFAGMPESTPDMDHYKLGSFRSTSLSAVRKKLASFKGVDFHPSVIPNTFSGLEQALISFAHIDVDQYETTKSCFEFIYPRLRSRGIIVIDDYGRPATVGVRLGAYEVLTGYRLHPLFSTRVRQSFNMSIASTTSSNEFSSKATPPQSYCSPATLGRSATIMIMHFQLSGIWKWCAWGPIMLRVLYLWNSSFNLHTSTAIDC
jgi:Macrocin-O-methyltransferase (TylF)